MSSKARSVNSSKARSVSGSTGSTSESTSASTTGSSYSESSASGATGGSITSITNNNTGQQQISFHESAASSDKGGTTGSIKQEPGKKATPTGRKLTIMRHGERMDRVLPNWHQLAFDAQGKYRPYNMNMPLKLPSRPGDELAYMIDSPLTEMGRMTSQILGRGLRKHAFKCTHVYASPAWRCVETACELLKGFGQPPDVQVRIEPGLFEKVSWYKDSEPEWIDPATFRDDLKMSAVDVGYQPIMSSAEVLGEKSETIEQCYNRVAHVIEEILMTQVPEDAQVLIVAHALTVDGGNRLLRQLPLNPPTVKDEQRLGLYYPNLCMVQVEEMTNETWRIVDNPMPPLSHLDVSNRIEAKYYTR